MDKRKAIKGDEFPRLLILGITFSALFMILFLRLWKIQIIQGKEYQENFELKVKKTLTDKGTRGNIYDHNGEVLAANELIYTISMIDCEDYETSRERNLALNSIIYKIRKKLNSSGEKLNNDLKIIVGSNGMYEYTVKGSALERFKADVFGFTNAEDMSKVQAKMSAEGMIEYLSGYKRFALYGEGDSPYSKEELEKYELELEYSKEEILDIVAIRYLLSLNAYRKYNSITVARDISEETMAYIEENNIEFPGIEIEVDMDRVYEGGEAFAHILGYTGKISADELENLSEDYTIDSIIGKIGLEHYLESKLHGIDGEREVFVNNVGRVLEEAKIIKKAEAGKDVYLTIDKDLQIAVYQILEQKLAGILCSNLINSKKFDKSKIRDTIEIKIPVYDVYMALVENKIIKPDRFASERATDLEKEIWRKIEIKKKNITEAFRKELLGEETLIKNLSEEMQDYTTVLFSENNIFKNIDMNNPLYATWQQTGDTTVKALMYSAILDGRINFDVVLMESKYVTSDEAYKTLADEIEKLLQESDEIEKIMLKYLLLNDEISGKDICLVLYEQGVFSKEDKDYQRLLNNRIDAFSFIKKKIENLEITPAQLALDPCSATAVVVEESTGAVLACVTYPGYDNNRLANQMDSQYYNQLLQDKSLPLYNRATQQLTAPGSITKPITIAAGLQEGVISPQTNIICDGIFNKVEPNLKCWKHVGHGEVTDAATAIQLSCNDYLCDISYRLGEKENEIFDDNTALKILQKYMGKFDLDKKSGIEITESQPHVTEDYAIPSAIGQGTHNYATVQLARYTNTLASRGNSFSLSLIKGITDKDREMEERTPKLESKVELSEDVWITLEKGMKQFAENNALLKTMKIEVAGKTGTAQESKFRPDHALFIGYAPVKEPEISIAVRIVNGYGSSNATSVGKDIFNYYFELEEEETILTNRASQAYSIRTD